jgi:hypothetical protein
VNPRIRLNVSLCLKYLYWSGGAAISAVRGRRARLASQTHLEKAIGGGTEMIRRLSLCAAAAALAGLGFSAQTARADLVVYEPFDYTAGAGALANQNGGSGWTGTWGAGTNNVVTPGLTFSKNGAALPASGNSSETVGANIGNFRSLPSTINSGTVYVSLLAKLDGGTPGSGYAGVSLFNGGSENVFIGQPSGKAVWGLDQATGPQSTTVAEDATTHLFVVQIDYGAGTAGNDRVRMYVDPTPGLDAPDVAAAIDVSTTRSASFNQIRIQSGGNQVAFDELRVTTDYASATPEPASLGLAAVAALGLLARRRRRGLRTGC